MADALLVIIPQIDSEGPQMLCHFSEIFNECVCREGAISTDDNIYTLTCPVPIKVMQRAFPNRLYEVYTK